jgi:hypothetical protein
MEGSFTIHVEQSTKCDTMHNAKNISRACHAIRILRAKVCPWELGTHGCIAEKGVGLRKNVVESTYQVTNYERLLG